MVKKVKKLFLIVFSALIFVFLNYQFSLAANLSLGISKQSYYQGDVFQAIIYVSSPLEAINAVKTTLNFDEDKLEVLSLSKTGSLINFWVSDPVFSNQSGLVSLEGVILNPGFQGDSGRLLTISFRAKKPGEALLDFSSSSILANDGLGTEVFKSATGARIFINEATSQKISQPTATSTKPTASSSQMASKKPYLNIKEIPRSDLTNPQVLFEIIGFDGEKSVDKFEIKIDNNSSEVWADDGSHLYKTPILKFGQHQLWVKALTDKVSDLINSVNFEIKPLETPVLNPLASEFFSDEPIIISGRAAPFYKILIYFQPLSFSYNESSAPLVFETQADANGDLSVRIEKNTFSAGLYNFWLEALNSLGAKSLATEKQIIKIKNRSWAVFSNFIRNNFWFLIVLGILILILVLVLVYFRNQNRLIKNLLGVKSAYQQKLIDKKIKEIAESLDEQIKNLEAISFRRLLTDEEKAMLLKFKKQREELKDVIEAS